MAAGRSKQLSASGVQELGVMLDVIIHEGVDEEVAVVVALQEETQRSGHEATRSD